MSGGDYFSRNGEELPFLARDIFISWLGKRREEGDGREIVGYEYVLQVFKSASSRSREENSLCMQSRDGEEHPDAAEVWFLTKEGAFYRLNTIKITDGGVQWSKSRCRKRGGKKKKKKGKALYGKQSGSFQRTKEREKFRENNGTDFISPWYPPPCLAFYARFDRPVRFLVTFPPDQWNIFAGKCSFFLTKFRRNSSSIFPGIMVEKNRKRLFSLYEISYDDRFELEKRFNFEESFGFCCFTIYWESR